MLKNKIKDKMKRNLKTEVLSDLIVENFLRISSLFHDTFRFIKDYSDKKRNLSL